MAAPLLGKDAAVPSLGTARAFETPAAAGPLRSARARRRLVADLLTAGLLERGEPPAHEGPRVGVSVR